MQASRVDTCRGSTLQSVAGRRAKARVSGSMNFMPAGKCRVDGSIAAAVDSHSDDDGR
jgi:hypothetical protein